VLRECVGDDVLIKISAHSALQPSITVLATMSPHRAVESHRASPVVFPIEMWHSPVGKQNDRHTERSSMKQKRDVQQGTLALMVLKTLDVLGPLHGYGIARRIEQISGDLLFVNQGTLYPVLLRLEQAEKRDWEQTAAIITRFFDVKAQDLT
jgi:PadR family transcriptional regulator PadR